MKTDAFTQNLLYFELMPRVVRSGVPTDMTLRATGGRERLDAAQYTVEFCPMEGGDAQPFARQTVAAESGTLRFTHAFPGEQAHQVRVYDGERRVATLYAYSLLPDLFARKPYRGDLHVHTYHSDGRESPAVVAANYRRAGYDFLAITDHGQYAPSVEAIEATEPLLPELWLFRGEEVHMHGTPIHLINFGSRESVNAVIQAQREAVDREIEALLPTLDVPEGVDRRLAAAYHWCCDRIRAVGGVAIYPHPYWVANVYHIPTAMSDYLFERGVFDAYELLGGQSVEENNMQTAHYFDLCARLGRTYPVVGSSDSHGTVEGIWFDRTQTMLFTSGKDALLDDLRAGYSVALETQEHEKTRIYGPYRLAKYAQFLEREYFPLHDERCYDQGRALRDAACGRDASDLAHMQNRTEALLARFFAR